MAARDVCFGQQLPVGKFLLIQAAKSNIWLEKVVSEASGLLFLRTQGFIRSISITEDPSRRNPILV